ncbi:MAG TPA: stage II sporulation protein M [Flavobacterium sp.]|nr:stage II sporulation protein M [Flavobacterium sp.]
MREVAFIKQNRDKWVAYEKVISGGVKKTPDEMADMYVQLINDLSFAQTYYPKSKLTKYLNYLSAQIYQKVYKTKRYEQNKFAQFFKVDVPLAVYAHRKYVYFAFVVFAIFIGIGVISSANDHSFVRLIMGDAYVNMTLENIENGDAMAVYQSSSNWGSSFGITLNNLYVGLRCYLFGIAGGVGTLLFVIYNAIMLGSFQYFFYQEGVFMESIRGIWLHGSMEIFAIVIESAAGFILGASILFPKTYSRMNSFKIGFRNSFKIYISTIPFTIFAGIIEGYITRYALAMPDVLNYLIIFGTLGLISYYYLIYPKKVYQKHHKHV